MSRAYRITVKEALNREVKGSDEICTKLDVLEILPPEQMAELLKAELLERGFNENEDGTVTRTDGTVSVTVEPCTGEVTVKSEAAERVALEANREATGYDDVGPGEGTLRDRIREQLKQELERKAEKESERLQTEATKNLEQALDDLQPELGQVINKITREALKQKAAQMGTITEIAENEQTGDLTIKIEV